MKIDPKKTKTLLIAFDFKALFREQLGWDNYQTQLNIPIDGKSFELAAIAQKSGFVAYICSAIPDRATRLKIDRQVAKSTHEHFIIYTDPQAGRQIWQWVRREPGKPLASRDHTFDVSHSGDPLIHRLDQIAVAMDEEENITIADVAGRARAAFNVEKVTKRFYDCFKDEHTSFMKFIKGIKSDADLQWYTSLMLNRLMFVYFIQKKGFLGSDFDYLRNRLTLVQKAQGKDRFHSFYRYFLLRLFHDGLGKAVDQRHLDPAMETLLGKIPYLNGGFFEVHQLEERNPDIDIPDQAFEKLFNFFDQYSWHLDERPLRADNEINPDVVGYIFEKYINQKQMGAYYTKEDITEYISKNTIIPFLFDAAEKKCVIAFKSDSALWRLLRDDPDRYIYAAVRHGVIHDGGDVVAESELPDFVQTGMNDPNARMFDKRYNLEQAPKSDSIRLPTETWREYVARRTRCIEIREKLRRGDVHQINDLITLNLDIWQFARDAIINSEGPELLRAFWHAIEKLTVLDPTCGSGAFLFAALRILETLYSDCLERMERFFEDLAGKKHHPEQYSDFKKVLAQIGQHPNDRYFILKSIIINNLFGVDIMEEAVEICKLRLFLKLVSQVETADQIEPLPDIDFNIRAGNTLVGYTSLAQVRKSQQGQLGFNDATIERIEEDAEMVERAFQQFRTQQTTHGGNVTHRDKQELRRRLTNLDDELDHYLAGDYKIAPGTFPSKVAYEEAFNKWKMAHQPFHWFIEFYGIMRAGGFDVVIGNPPYVVFSETKVSYGILSGQYKTLPTKNLYAFVFERSVDLAQPASPIGLIIQLTAISSERLVTLQDLLSKRGRLVAISFPRRPESVFEGVEMPVVILLSTGTDGAGCFVTSRINRFYTEQRPSAIANLQLCEHRARLHRHRIAKFGVDTEERIYRKLIAGTVLVDSLAVANGNGILFYQEACRYWLKAFDKLPYFTRNGKKMEPPHGRVINFKSVNAASCVACLLNSSLFYWHYSTFSDCEHVNDILLRQFVLPGGILQEDWTSLTRHLMKRLDEAASRKVIRTKQGHIIEYDEMAAIGAKPIIDAIDTAMVKHYGFTNDELDFIVNYDIKYRMGQRAEGEEDE